MRKIQANGLKFKARPVDRGVRHSVVFHGAQHPEKAIRALLETFDINEELAKVVVSSKPVVICRDLDQERAAEYVRRLKGAGDFRAWVESAAGRLKQMNLKQRNPTTDLPVPEILRRR
jgi:hypothetical protein